MSPPAAARLDEFEDQSQDPGSLTILSPDVQAELHRRLQQVDEMRARGLLVDADDVLPDDL